MTEKNIIIIFLQTRVACDVIHQKIFNKGTILYSVTQHADEEEPPESNGNEVIWVTSVVGVIALCAFVLISIIIYRKSKCIYNNWF